MPAEITEWGAAMMMSLAAAMALFFSAIPKIFGFLISDLGVDTINTLAVRFTYPSLADEMFHSCRIRVLNSKSPCVN